MTARDQWDSLAAYDQREVAVAMAGRELLSETHTLGLGRDCRLTKR